MDLERDLPAALAGLVPDDVPPGKSPQELQTKARVRVRRQRILTSAGVVMAVVIAVGASAALDGVGRSPKPPASSPTPTSTQAPLIESSVRLMPTGRFGPGWSSDGVIPYGARADQLGVDTSNTACPPGCGPDSAVLGPSGTWFVHDSQNHRVLEYNRSGQRLGFESDLGTELDGVSSQGAYNMHVLDDGTIVLDDGGRLILAGASPETRSIAGLPDSPPAVIGDDGTHLFLDDPHGLQMVYPQDETASAEPSPLRLRDGSGFQLLPGDKDMQVNWLAADGVTTVSQTRVDFGEEFQYTWSAGHTELVLLVEAASGNRGAVVHVSASGVDAESTIDAAPQRADGLATLSSNKLGWIGVAAAENDGLHLYHRVAPGGVAAAPNLNGHTCDGPPAPARDDVDQRPDEMAADLDGDRRPDRVFGYVIDGIHVVQVEFADGRYTQPQELADLPFDSDGSGGEPLGVHDFDGDGKDEVLMRSAGMTGDAGAVVHLDGCKLVAVLDESSQLGFSYSYGSHSNCCPDTHVYVTCSGPDLIEVTSQPDATAVQWIAMSDATRSQLRRTWERNVYRVGSTSAHRISHTTGKTAPGKDVIPAGASGVHC